MVTTNQVQGNSAASGNIYRDYGNVQQPNPSESSYQRENAKHTQNFPVRLHYVLTELEKDGLDCIMSWLPHGRSFIVHDQKQLETSVLPLWFRQSKFASFQRQLNIYGFTRINSGPDKGGYYHELFLRGKLFLAQGIQRTKIKGMGPRKPAAGEIQPDFYALPPLENSNFNNSSTTNDTSSRPDEQSSAPPALTCTSGLSGPACADLNVNLASLLISSLQVQHQQSQQQQQQEQQQRFLDHLSTLVRSTCATSAAVNTNASSLPDGMASHVLSQTLVELFESILAKDKMAGGSTDPNLSHAAEPQFLGRD